jgi:hypothetical protein
MDSSRDRVRLGTQGQTLEDENEGYEMKAMPTLRGLSTATCFLLLAIAFAMSVSQISFLR